MSYFDLSNRGKRDTKLFSAPPQLRDSMTNNIFFHSAFRLSCYIIYFVVDSKKHNYI